MGARASREPGEQRDVAADERSFGDDRDGVLELEADGEAPPRQLVRRFEGLIAAGVAREGDHVSLPGSLRELLAEELGRVVLDDDLAIEVGACAPAEVLVRGPRTAAGAGVEAAAAPID